MPVEALLELLDAQPFRPFRILMADGAGYEVRHPEMVMVEEGWAYVGYPAPGRRRLVQRVDMIALAHVSRCEFITQAATA